jgi:hypothetical protein
VEAYLDLDAQLQTNGFDFTLRALSLFVSRGQMALDNGERVLPETRDLTFHEDGWLELGPGQLPGDFQRNRHIA